MGIIDKVRNPFSIPFWVEQGYGLTPGRRLQLQALLGEDEKGIRKEPRNRGAYVAFVAIRWGFAEMSHGILTAKDIWLKNSMYDDYGKRK